ncbi:MAG: hypothetical protein PHG69_00215 [Candidatus Omnitrophica bacterium]|nr:hypothetical protein [Candidatus Omnitrophota bacterium]
MFNLKDLGDMSKIASQAKELQQAQQKTEDKKIQLLSKISQQLDELLAELKKDK